jgi:hypothetical protein
MESSQKKKKEQTIDVLYQKLGSHWFAFSLIDNEVFFSPIPEERVEKIRHKLILDKNRQKNAG